jgi:hypothetical protein
MDQVYSESVGENNCEDFNTQELLSERGDLDKCLEGDAEKEAIKFLPGELAWDSGAG